MPNKTELGPHLDAARNFIRETILDREGNLEWNARRESARKYWYGAVYHIRSVIDPKLFEYYEGRSRGIVPPPEPKTWPRSQAQAVNDWVILERETKKPGGIDWKEVKWSKASTQDDAAGYLPDNEVSPSHITTNNRSRSNSSNALEPNSRIQEHRELPKAKIMVSPEKIQFRNTGPLDIQVKVIPEEELIEIPTGFRLHPDRPWTEADRRILYNLVEDGSNEFVIDRILQRHRDQWHQVYRYWANLQVHEPHTGEWSAEMDAMLVRFIEEYKIKNWDRIAFHLGTTVEEARRYWASRSSIRTGPESESKRPVTDNVPEASNQTTDEFLSALNDMLTAGRPSEEENPSAVELAAPANTDHGRKRGRDADPEVEVGSPPRKIRLRLADHKASERV